MLCLKYLILCSFSKQQHDFLTVACFSQQRYFLKCLKCDGRAKLAGRGMSSPLSFMQYVCYIITVHLCIEKSELSQTVWLIFLYTLTVGSAVMLVYQGHRSWLCQDFFTTDAHSFSFIFCYDPKFPFWIGNFLSICPAPVISPPLQDSQELWVNSKSDLLDINCATYQGDVLFPLLFDISLTLRDPSHRQNWKKVTNKSTMEKYPVWEWARLEPLTHAVHPASDWQIPWCYNNLPRGDDVKTRLMLRCENCVHGRL